MFSKTDTLALNVSIRSSDLRQLISSQNTNSITENHAFKKIIARCRENMLRQPKNNELPTISMPSPAPKGHLSSGFTHASQSATDWTYWGRGTLRGKGGKMLSK